MGVGSYQNLSLGSSEVSHESLRLVGQQLQQQQLLQQPPKKRVKRVGMVSKRRSRKNVLVYKGKYLRDEACRVQWQERVSSHICQNA